MIDSLWYNNKTSHNPTISNLTARYPFTRVQYFSISFPLCLFSVVFHCLSSTKIHTHRDIKRYISLSKCRHWNKEHTHMHMYVCMHIYINLCFSYLSSFCISLSHFLSLSPSTSLYLSITSLFLSLFSFLLSLSHTSSFSAFLTFTLCYSLFSLSLLSLPLFLSFYAYILPSPIIFSLLLSPFICSSLSIRVSLSRTNTHTYIHSQIYK